MKPHGLAKRPWRRLAIVAFASALIISGWVISAVAQEEHDELDPAHNIPLPCELVSTPSQLPRSAKNIAHLANICGFVGTDVEFQSRMANDGLHDYSFVGTMGAGLRIFDITDPAHPFVAGEYTDPGWQNDVQVRGDIAVIGFDPLSGSAPAPSLSTCLQAKSARGGVDVVRLHFDSATATFQTTLLDCVTNLPGGGAHNSTLHPSGNWLALSNPRGHGSVDVVDLRGMPKFRYRIVQNGSLNNSVCTTLAAPATCITNARPGTWSPHDIHFSQDGNTMYVAAVGNDTLIVDVSSILSGSVSTISVIPNNNEPGGLANPGNIQISHQSDVSADGKLLVITDERGGGLQETGCNTDSDNPIGAMHFWALAPIAGQSHTNDASPANPRKLGFWIYPNPLLAVDALDPILAGLGRTERACTIHVFRLGGNGSASPGPIQPGFDGVSSLPIRQTVSAHYGAGVWHIDFSSAPSAADGTTEDPRTTWGNTRGWNVMPGAETWSAKEYKGFIYAGDMARGFDVYHFTNCEGLGCITPPPTNTPGSATGGGQIESELAELTILRGTAAGGRANFGFNAQFTTGDLAPSGHLTFIDHGSRQDVRSTSIDSFRVVGNRAMFTGRAIVNGVPGVSFFVEVEDFGEPGSADTFRIVLGDGYGAAGVLLRGNIQVRSGAL